MIPVATRLFEEGKTYLEERFNRLEPFERQKVNLEDVVLEFSIASSRLYSAIAITPKVAEIAEASDPPNPLTSVIAATSLPILVLMPSKVDPAKPWLTPYRQRSREFLPLEEQTEEYEAGRRLDTFLAECGQKRERVLFLVSDAEEDEAIKWAISDLQLALLEKGGTDAGAENVALPFLIQASIAMNGWPFHVALPVVRDSACLSGAEALSHLFNSLVLARPINLLHNDKRIESGLVLDELEAVRIRARENCQKAKSLLFDLAARLRNHEDLFDNKSGAVMMAPDYWRGLKDRQQDVIGRLYAFLNEPMPDYWNQDYPGKKRVLWLPTKVLLRGETYYLNLRNISPFVRLESMVAELDEVNQQIIYIRKYANADDECEWKLSLAILDLARNASLIFLAFVHAAKPFFSHLPVVATGIDGLFKERCDLHKFVTYSIRAYYSWLCGRAARARYYMDESRTQWNDVGPQLKSLINTTREAARQTASGDLVRKWREADHPGDNLLTGLLAHLAQGDKPTLAVGIGWGGIELPLVYDYIGDELAPQAVDREVAIARWSHYRQPETPVQWDTFGRAGQIEEDLGQVDVALFDDNTLTGVTLERVRNDLLQRNAGNVRPFVVRYSDERRYAQMQMRKHGAIDPQALLEYIGGYIGQTPFARSWSRRVYTNPIGEFSLARQRILKCLHNNSTHVVYDREGFSV